MTLGDGIFWSTVLILLAGTIYQISVRKKWKLVGRVFGILILIGGLGGGGVWGWITYQNQPYAVDELANVRPGMTPVEVTIARGEPQSKDEPTLGKDNEWRMLWMYGDIGESKILFSGSTADELTVALICTEGWHGDLLTLDRSASEEDVIKKLGEPTHESISDSGLSKIISYRQWNVAYEITTGRVSQLCVTDGEAVYQDEYGDDSEAAEE